MNQVLKARELAKKKRAHLLATVLKKKTVAKKVVVRKPVKKTSKKTATKTVKLREQVRKSLIKKSVVKAKRKRKRRGKKKTGLPSPTKTISMVIFPDHTFPKYVKGSDYLLAYDRIGDRPYQKLPEQMMEKEPPFDMIPIRYLNIKTLRKYKVVCLEMVSKNYISDASFKELMGYCKAAGCSTILSLCDLHESTFTTRVPRRRERKYKYRPPKKAGIGCKIFLDYLKEGSCKYLISFCECPEFNTLKAYCKSYIKDSFVIPFHVSPSLFKDYGLEKEYDVCLTGKITIRYRFRKRLYQIVRKMKETHGLRVLEGPFPYGEKLSQAYNKSWLSVATLSNYSYLVRKYPEIAASGSVILGNINDQGRRIWEDNLVELNNSMTDEEIQNAIMAALENKDRLKEMSRRMTEKLHRDYNIEMYNRKLHSIIQRVAIEQNI